MNFFRFFMVRLLVWWRQHHKWSGKGILNSVNSEDADENRMMALKERPARCGNTRLVINPQVCTVSRPGFSQSRETRLACHIFIDCKRLTDNERTIFTHRPMDWW
nr:MAG TPA_asm: hypothetical protein [Caudoviricetes sp.]DAL36859.1 MAG TPA_asm: hypothetical protein [Caudoviricetes sp.]